MSMSLRFRELQPHTTPAKTPPNSLAWWLERSGGAIHDLSVSGLASSYVTHAESIEASPFVAIFTDLREAGLLWKQIVFLIVFLQHLVRL